MFRPPFPEPIQGEFMAKEKSPEPLSQKIGSRSRLPSPSKPPWIFEKLTETGTVPSTV